jgi:hypothetical protein
MEEQTPGRPKRPDVVERLKARKGKEERVVKCALSKRLVEKSLIDEIQKWVNITSKVSKMVEGKLREVRGLRWCCSTNCRTFKDRDLNAAINILRCFQSGAHRPHSLSRNFGVQKVARKTLLISCANSMIPDKAR